jgi:hypothetical protein
MLGPYPFTTSSQPTLAAVQYSRHLVLQRIPRTRDDSVHLAAAGRIRAGNVQELRGLAPALQLQPCQLQVGACGGEGLLLQCQRGRHAESMPLPFPLIIRTGFRAVIRAVAPDNGSIHALSELVPS